MLCIAVIAPRWLYLQDRIVALSGPVWLALPSIQQATVHLIFLIFEVMIYCYLANLMAAQVYFNVDDQTILNGYVVPYHCITEQDMFHMIHIQLVAMELSNPQLPSQNIALVNVYAWSCETHYIFFTIKVSAWSHDCQ